MALFIFSAPDWPYKMSISSWKPRFSNISWFSDISTVTFLWLFIITPYLSTWNINLPPWDLFLNSNEENNIIIWHLWGISAKSQIPTPMDLNTLSVILNFHFFEWCLMIFDDILCIFHGNMKSRRRGISWDSFSRRNFGKSLDMNLVPIKKHESTFRRNGTTFCTFGRGESLSYFSKKWNHFLYFWAR